MLRRHSWIRALAVSAAALAAIGCGSSARGHIATTATAHPVTSRSVAPSAASELAAAEHPQASEFPPAAGHSLRQLAQTATATAQLGAATATFTPGVERLAFALTASGQRFVYASTALYIARAPSSPASGPFLAPADPLVVPQPDRSQEDSAPGELQSIYWADLPLREPGVYDVLALTRTRSSFIGASGQVKVAARSRIPDVGQRPPPISTDTLASVHGKLALLTTRIPPENMHSVSLTQVLGKRPVALLFSTPQLCTSRICGPVTDLTVSLQREFAHRIVFIHQEVYVDNQPSHGLRPQLTAFHLQTEPWLFAINRHGVIVARLEGAFGGVELRRALEAALR